MLNLFKIGEDNWIITLWWTQMRESVEKLEMLSYTLSKIE